MENSTYPNLHVPQTKYLQICRCSQFLHLSGTSGHTRRCVFAITKVSGEQTELLPPFLPSSARTNWVFEEIIPKRPRSDTTCPFPMRWMSSLNSKDPCFSKRRRVIWPGVKENMFSAYFGTNRCAGKCIATDLLRCVSFAQRWNWNWSRHPSSWRCRITSIHPRPDESTICSTVSHIQKAPFT